MYGVVFGIVRGGIKEEKDLILLFEIIRKLFEWRFLEINWNLFFFGD